MHSSEFQEGEAISPQELVAFSSKTPGDVQFQSLTMFELWEEVTFWGIHVSWEKLAGYYVTKDTETFERVTLHIV